MNQRQVNSIGIFKPDLHQESLDLSVAITSSNGRIAFDHNVAIRNITIHADGTVADDLQVYIDRVLGAQFDTKIADVTASWTDILIEPEHGPLTLVKDDALVFTCDNTATDQIGIVVTYEIL